MWDHTIPCTDPMVTATPLPNQHKKFTKFGNILPNPVALGLAEQMRLLHVALSDVAFYRGRFRGSNTSNGGTMSLPIGHRYPTPCSVALGRGSISLKQSRRGYIIEKEVQTLMAKHAPIVKGKSHPPV